MAYSSDISVLELFTKSMSCFLAKHAVPSERHQKTLKTIKIQQSKIINFVTKTVWIIYIDGETTIYIQQGIF